MRIKEYLNAGGFRLEKVAVDLDKVDCIQKPLEDGIGCIVVIQGQKYPVRESYEAVLKDLAGEGK